MLPLATSVLLQLSIFTTHVTITASISKPTQMQFVSTLDVTS